jgi:alkylation response protein AidB-like acyl-CoA dehydrogenase
VLAHVLIERPGSGPPASHHAALPAANVEIHDNWHVSGLKGTGSCDFSAADVFVPDGFTFDLQAMVPQRGGPAYRLGLPAFFISVHAGFALGVGRRALAAITELAQTKRRGYGKQTPLAERSVFQRMLGESDLRLRAARGLVLEILEKAWATAC